MKAEGQLRDSNNNEVRKQNLSQVAAAGVSIELQRAIKPPSLLKTQAFEKMFLTLGRLQVSMPSTNKER